MKQINIYTPVFFEGEETDGCTVYAYDRLTAIEMFKDNYGDIIEDAELLGYEEDDIWEVVDFKENNEEYF